jgi:hypothetical protein
VFQRPSLQQGLQSIFLLNRSTEILELRVFAVELYGVGEAVGVVKRVGEVDFGVLVFLYSLYDSGQFHHDLLHALQQLVIALVAGSVG